MNEQHELGEAYARVSDPGTSHAAAESVKGEVANKMESLVLTTLKAHYNGLTNHELVAATGLPWSSITPRVRPLVNRGLVEDSGIKKKGPTNRMCTVWRAVV